MIKHNEYRLQTDLIKHQHAVKAIESPCTLIVAEQTARRLCEMIGYKFKPEEFYLKIDAGYRISYSSSRAVKGCYDQMLSQPSSYLDSKDLNFHKEQQIILVSHGNIVLNVNVLFYEPISEDDMKTLRLLGKVHEEHIPGRIETSIFCEV